MYLARPGRAERNGRVVRLYRCGPGPGPPPCKVACKVTCIDSVHNSLTDCPSMSLRHRIQRPASPGQALVEFALILPLLVLLLVMAVDFGRVFFGWVAVQNASRIAADYASQRPDAWPADNPFEEDTQAQYRDVVQHDLNSINCDPQSGNDDWQESDVPDPTFPDGNDYGNPTVVELSCEFTLITPLAQNLLGGLVTINASSTFAIHQGNVLALPSAPPTATPTPVPTPTGTPAPTNCTVPQTVGGKRNDARNLWSGRLFTTSLVENGNGNFTVASQSLSPNASVPCNSVMTITEAGQPTPSPTPVPTATPIPTATPAPTPTPVPTPAPTPCPSAVASFTFSPAAPITGQDVQFTDTSTTAAGCPITSWNWTFSDPPSSTVKNPVHKFNQAGIYLVTLTVTSSAGTAQATQIVPVTP